MKRIVKIEGVGSVVFPDSMSDAEVSQAAGRLYDDANPTPNAPHAAGHVAPAVITGAQKAAATAKSAAGTAAQVGALAEGDASRPWMRVQTSDGKMYEVHPEDVEELQRRDPGARIIEQPNKP